MFFSPCISSLFKDEPVHEYLESIHNSGYENYEFWSWWDQDLAKILCKHSYLKMRLAAMCTHFIPLNDPKRRKEYSLDGALEDAAKNLGAGEIYTFRRVIFPVILPTVMAIAALNFNSLLSDYDMSAFLFHPLNPPLGVQIRSLTNDMNNPNGMALTFVYAVLLMIIATIVLYHVYGRGGNDRIKE